tara:strand:- start:104 stop:3079 length:2976 start_codon:yes stop_codon:yes gene_type:complete
MAGNPTFDCGTLLPGVGPGNLPGFDGGGTIEGGGGGNGNNNNGGGSTRIDTLPPIGPEPKDGNGPGPGPPDIGTPVTGGPPTGPGPPPNRGNPVVSPGPPGPGPPGPSQAPLYCKITGPWTSQGPPMSGPTPTSFERTYTATQTCSPADFSDTDDHNKKSVDDKIESIKNYYSPPRFPEGTRVTATSEGYTFPCDPQAGASCGVATIIATINIPDTPGNVYDPPDPPPPPPPEGDPEVFLDPTGPPLPPPEGDPEVVLDPTGPPLPPPEADPGLVLDPTGPPPPPPEGDPGLVLDDPWFPIGDQDPIEGVLVDPGEDPRPDVTRIENSVPTEDPTTGQNLIRSSSFDRNSLINNAISSREIDLNNPSIVDGILRKRPFGIQERSIAFDTVPPSPMLVKNDTGNLELFSDLIDSNLHYILSNQRNSGNWDSRRAAAITNSVIFDNLNDETLQVLRSIKNYDGTSLTLSQVFNIIGSRVLDGTITKINLSFLKSMAEDSKKRNPVNILRSVNPKVNEVAALSLIDENKVPLDPTRSASRESNLFKNWKILSSDIDKYLPITINGISEKYYLNDDDTFINRNTLSIEDGDYFDITLRGESLRLFTESEKDHAYLIPEKTRHRAISLLGGNPGRVLDVSADPLTASAIEFDSSLTSTRQPFYMLSCVLTSLDTRPSEAGSFLLKDTTAKYELMDTTTAEGLAEVNEFIKYKANKRIFILKDTDLLIDYVEQTSHLHLTQTDILFDSPKTNKTLPLLVRQIPFYIMLYPSNRTDYNIFNDSSQIDEISTDGSISRKLVCLPVLTPEFTKGQTNKFIRYSTAGRDAQDILGNPDSQARKSVVDPTDPVFQTAYRRRGKYMPSSEYDHDRAKTGFRVVREIVKELDNNYELSVNGVGKTLTEFDVFSRLNLKQFNVLSILENFDQIYKSIRNGLINQVKLIPPVGKADNRIVVNKTQLIQRKTTAGVDTFKQIKATNDGQNIISPDESGKGGLSPAAS